MNISKKEYSELVKKNSPPSKKLKNCLMAFLVGGGICAFGQGLFFLFQSFGLNEEKCYALCSLSIIALTAILTGIGIFDKIAKIGGAGTLIPVSGFANAVASPAIEFRSEGVVMGLCANLFKIAGPVIVCGTVSSVIYGIIYWLYLML